MAASDAGTYPGTYVLLLWNARAQTLDIGRHGQLRAIRGWYLYVGSAFGPGGVAARLAHHKRLAERPHWHIDYARRAMPLREIWYSHDGRGREHEWATLIGEAPESDIPLARFGASDCGCASHLFHLKRRPDFAWFSDMLRQRYPRHASLHREALGAM